MTLSCLYFSLSPWACWLVFLPYQPIDPLTLSVRLPRPIYYIFTSYHSLWVCWPLCHVSPLGLPFYSLGFLGPFTTSLPLYCSYGLIGHHSCHISSLSLPLYFLGFLGPFTSSLILIILMVYYFIYWVSLAHLLLLYLLLASWAY